MLGNLRTGGDISRGPSGKTLHSSHDSYGEWKFRYRVWAFVAVRGIFCIIQMQYVSLKVKQTDLFLSKEVKKNLFKLH